MPDRTTNDQSTVEDDAQARNLQPKAHKTALPALTDRAPSSSPILQIIGESESAERLHDKITFSTQSPYSSP